MDAMLVQPTHAVQFAGAIAALVDDEPPRVSRWFWWIRRCGYPQASRRTETALAETMADFGCFGWPPPAGRMARIPRGAGPASKGKGPETFRALVIGGVFGNRTRVRYPSRIVTPRPWGR